MGYASIRKILTIILLLNLLVALVKIAYGRIISSLSIEADGYHSLFDGVSNIIGLVAIAIASKPADSNHPYGHGKFESVAALLIGILLFITGYNLLTEAIHRYSTPVTPVITVTSFLVLLVTITINIMVTTYEKRKGLELKSEILIADSYHTRSDVCVSIGVIATLIAVRAGYPQIDVAAAMIIAVFIGYTGVMVLKESTGTLCDASQMDGRDVCAIVESLPEVLDCHNIRTRGTKNNTYIDMHITVDSGMRIDRAHELTLLIEKMLREKISGVEDVIIHIEPEEINKEIKY